MDNEPEKPGGSALLRWSMRGTLTDENGKPLLTWTADSDGNYVTTPIDQEK